MTAREKLIIVGGGLAGALAALAMHRLRPDVPLVLVEQEERFGGNHVWSFFDADVRKDHRWLADPLIVKQWPDYEIRFPARQRILATGYNSIKSARLDEAVRASLPSGSLRGGAAVARIEPDAVTLASGETIPASAVIDARGPGAESGLDLGWQKFVGRDLALSRPHGLDRPVVMDATVDQEDGYRFVYCLPFDERRLLVEDTYYSLSPALDPALLRDRLDRYVAAQGWSVDRVENEEQGVLPVALGGKIDGYWRSEGIARLGLAGGFFHPTTGYSLPDAVRNAMLLAQQPSFEGDALYRLFRARALALWRRRGFYRLLNRMLFHAARPGDRYRVLEHFYRLDTGVIERFYAGRSTLADRLRILSGRPPVPIGAAARALMRSGSG